MLTRVSSLDAFPILIILNAVFLSWLMHHNTISSNVDHIRIWDGPAPFSNGNDNPRVPLPHQHHPSLQVFVPDNNDKNRTAVIVLPGGGYQYLATHETFPPCEWFQENGIVAFALNYRLGPKYKYPVQLIDVQRAIKYVRYHASKWNIDQDKILLLGFSAGGHLASMASSFYSLQNDSRFDPVERKSSRPDMQILVYPVIDFSISYRTVSALLGHNPFPSQKILETLSTHLSVDSKVPPAFVVHSTRDELVSIENSIRYVDALRRANISVEFCSQDFGPHGFGMDDEWNIPALEWVHRNLKV